MKWVIAGGGTGGHLFPGIAIAEAFVEKEKGNEVLFIGTERGLEARVLTGGKFPLRMIQAKPIQGRSYLERLKAVWSLPIALYEAFLILKEFRPDLVVGVGGYASGPALLTAYLLGLKRVIHEQNAIPGMTNQILKWFSQRIFVSFEETKRYFPEKKTVVTGNPIRKEFLKSLKQNQREQKRKDRFTVFVFGGSAGAHRINQVMTEALDDLQSIQGFLKIIHQTGKEDLDFVARKYQEKGFDAQVKPFIEDMATAYSLADLVICRSGASTVAELSACGKAALLIPYPFATHQHQLINAKRLVERGAAKMILDKELNGKVIAQHILQLYRQPEERARMEEAIRKLARPEAAETIIDHCYKLLGRME